MSRDDAELDAQPLHRLGMELADAGGTDTEHLSGLALRETLVVEQSEELLQARGQALDGERSLLHHELVLGIVRRVFAAARERAMEGVFEGELARAGDVAAERVVVVERKAQLGG